MSPALAGGFLTTVPPRKSHTYFNDDATVADTGILIIGAYRGSSVILLMDPFSPLSSNGMGHELGPQMTTVFISLNPGTIGFSSLNSCLVLFFFLKWLLGSFF